MVSRFFTTTLRLDPWLLGSVAILCSAGLLNLVGTPNSTNLFLKQSFFIGAGILVLILLAALDYRWFRSSPLFGILIWAFGVSLLAFVAFFGQKVRGVQNWIIVGPFSLGPIELVKFGVLLVLARYLAREHAGLVFFNRVAVSAIAVFIPILLTFFQPDFGSAVILGSLWFFLIFLLRIPIRTIALLLLLFIFVGGIAWNSVLHDYQRTRITAFFLPHDDPLGAAYQTRQATIAVGASGLFGRGFFSDSLASTLSFLPENATDFAFASVVERTGLIGALILILAFAILLFRIQRVALRATNNFSCVYAAGLFTLLAIEIVFNIGMNLGLLPVAGVPLPFVSYGGSHTLLMFATLGLLESVRLRQPRAFVYDRDPIGELV